MAAAIARKGTPWSEPRGGVEGMSCVTDGTRTDMYVVGRDGLGPRDSAGPTGPLPRGQATSSFPTRWDESAKGLRVASVENRIPPALAVLLTAVAALVSVAYLWRCSRPKNQPRPRRKGRP